ncbi:MAG: histidine kinase [Bacteroidota bacterium]
MFLLSKTYHHWSLERILRHVAYWCFWWAFYMVVNANSYGNGEYLPWLLLEMLVLPIKLSFVYFVVYYLLPKYSAQKKYILLLLTVIGLAILGGIVIRVLDIYVAKEYIDLSDSFHIKIGGSQFISGKIAYRALDLLFITSLVISVKFLQQQIQHERKTKNLLTQKLSTELQFLKHQLQPHFLFNTLNNLYGMILTKDEKAGDIVIKLSEIMNYMLYESNDTLVSIDKELANLNNYIELEKIRYGDELHVRTEVKGDTKHRKIPPLILVSFVENAFKHGPSDNLGSSWIRIEADISNHTFSFMVENSLPLQQEGTGKKKSSEVNSGIGLANVRKRLDLIYGDNYKLKIRASDTYVVQLKIKKFINGDHTLYHR